MTPERPCTDCPLTNAGRLTPREREVIGHIAKGMSNKEAALQLNVAEGTIKMNLHQIYRKTGAKNRTALAIMFSQAKP
jgi:two-component system nitrate/nitrite response regulator NarL